jgi:protein TonB
MQMNANTKHRLLLLSLGLACFTAPAQQSATSGNTNASPPASTDKETSKTDVAPCPAEFTLRYLPDGIYRVGGGVSAPVPTRTPEATLSNEAREFIKEQHIKQFEAISIVSLTVDTKGAPQDVCVVKKAGYGLDRQALESVAKYRFKPGTLHGKPVPDRFAVEVNFATF